MASALVARVFVSATHRISVLAAMIVWSCWHTVPAVAEQAEPCRIIAHNLAVPLPSSADADRYAQLATMFSELPELQNLAIHHLVETKELRDLLDVLNRHSGIAEASAPLFDVRTAVADRLQAAIDRERGTNNEDYYPLTEDEQVFEVGSPPSHGKAGQSPRTIVVAGYYGLAAVELDAGGIVNLPRRLGQFDRFGAFALGGEAWLFRVFGDPAVGGSAISVVALHPLTGGAATDAGAESAAFCESRVAIDKTYHLEPHVERGARPPDQSIMEEANYVVSSLMGRVKPYFGPGEEWPVFVYEPSSGANWMIDGQTPTEIIAKQIGLDWETADLRLREIWVTGDPGVTDAERSKMPRNIRGLLDGAGPDQRMLILVKRSVRDSVLCAVYASAGTGRLDAFISLLSSRPVGSVACTVLLPIGDPADASEAILANRAAEDWGDGFAYRLIERDVVIGLPDTP